MIVSVESHKEMTCKGVNKSLRISICYIHSYSKNLTKIMSSKYFHTKNRFKETIEGFKEAIDNSKMC